MKTILLWLIVAGLLAIAFVLYQSHSRKDHLNVDPHAAEEIDKAKRR